jgi:hypothetical protein
MRQGLPTGEAVIKSPLAEGEKGSFGLSTPIDATEPQGIMTLGDLIPAVIVGVMFTVLGSLKFYGLYRGIEGGRGKPWVRRLCGT